MVRRSTFNRDGESSILSSFTNEIVCRRRLVARIADLQSADGSSILLAGTSSAHRPESVVRSRFVPFVQWIRTERYERSDSGSSPERDTKFFRSGGRAARHLTVHEDQVGSTPIHFAKFSGE